MVEGASAGAGRWNRALGIVARSWHIVPLAVAVALVARMAAASMVNAHPDEWFHGLTASYYLTHWLAPTPHAADLPRYLHPCYGTTYLWGIPQDLAYFVAGKLAAAADHVAGVDWAHALRAFHVLLFALLALLAARRRPGDPLVLALLLTPQVWYIFSYFNGDALPLFLSLVLASELGTPGSLTREFLEASDGRRRWGAGVLLWLLVTLLVFCRQNYLVFLAFVGLCGVWMVARAAPGIRMRMLRRGALVLAAVAVTAGVLVGEYVLRMGPDSGAKVLEIRESHAADGFRPSQIGQPKSFPGLAMHQRGVPFRYMFQTLQWHHYTFDSAFGVYGYMKIYAPEWFYGCCSALLLALVLLAGAAVWRVRDRGKWLLAAGTVGFLALAVAQSIYHSWTFDFQAQGRYLFPMLPMALLGWQLMTAPDRGRIPAPVTLAAFLLSAGSFVCVALARIEY